MEVAENLGLTITEASFLVIDNKITSYLYNPDHTTIKILSKNNKVLDFAEASDQWNSLSMQKPVTKFYCCYPKK